MVKSFTKVMQLLTQAMDSQKKWSLVKCHNVSFVRTSLCAGILLYFSEACNVSQNLQIIYSCRMNQQEQIKVATGLFTLVAT